MSAPITAAHPPVDLAPAHHAPSRSLTRRSRTRTRRSTIASDEDHAQPALSPVDVDAGHRVEPHRDSSSSPPPLSNPHYAEPRMDMGLGASKVPFPQPSPSQAAERLHTAAGSAAVHLGPMLAATPGGSQVEREGEKEEYVRAWTRSLGESSRPANGERALEEPTSSQPMQPNAAVGDNDSPWRKNRDSGWTEQSITSSSVYPNTTSTVSAVESPPSLVPDEQSKEPSSASMLSSEELCLSEQAQLHLDADDVSFRLRLLMRNNYYLPPAHSKPMPVQVENHRQPTKKTSAPAFLDLFRVGKSRSKATTPTTPLSPDTSPIIGPVLRATSDSGGVSMSSRPFLDSASLKAPMDRGRVVVVRETVEDIAVAAKQAEKAMRIRSQSRPRANSEAAKPRLPTAMDVDPTEAVDLPPLPPNFQPQASAMQGLGVDQSVGAATLADQLPPSGGEWSIGHTEESIWRRALLHQAVGHSLNNTPAVTPVASPFPGSSVSTPASSMHLVERSRNLPTRTSSRGVPAPSTVVKNPTVGQHIIPPAIIPQTGEMLNQESNASVRVNLVPSSIKANRRRSSSAPRTLHLSPQDMGLFPRSPSPAMLPAPLTPPPPRTNHVFCLPAVSHSQTNLSAGISRGPLIGNADRRHIRKSMSTPFLSSAWYDADESVPQHDRTHPLLPPNPLRAGPSVRINPGTPRSKRKSSDSGSRYSGLSTYQTPHSLSPPRMPSIHRDSTSDITVRTRSSTESVFHDVHSAGYHTPQSPPPRRSVDSRVSGVSHVSSTFHNLVVQEATPPIPTPSIHSREYEPRISTSSARTVAPALVQALPRTTSIIGSAPGTPRASISSSHLSGSSRPSNHSQSSFLNLDPFESHAPQFPLAERRGQGIHSHLAVYSSLPAPSALRSAPQQPASPITFFDQIQTGPNGMDTLDSSDDEDESDDIATLEDADRRREEEIVRQRRERQDLQQSLLREGDTSNSDNDTDAGDSPDAVVFVDQRTRAISNTSSGSRSKSSLMRLGNHSTPYFTPHSRENLTLEFDPLGRLSPALSGSKKFGKGMSGFALPEATRDFIRSMEMSSQQKTGSPRLSTTSNTKSTSNQRPTTSSSDNSIGGKPSSSIRQFEGRLAEHIEAEKDVIRRIKNNMAR